jgi:hypothetical protein
MSICLVEQEALEAPLVTKRTDSGETTQCLREVREDGRSCDAVKPLQLPATFITVLYKWNANTTPRPGVDNCYLSLDG